MVGVCRLTVQIRPGREMLPLTVNSAGPEQSESASGPLSGEQKLQLLFAPIFGVCFAQAALKGQFAAFSDPIVVLKALVQFEEVQARLHAMESDFDQTRSAAKTVAQQFAAVQGERFKRYMTCFEAISKCARAAACPWAPPPTPSGKYLARVTSEKKTGCSNLRL